MKILIADDHSIVRTGLRYVIESLAVDITIYEAENYYVALELVKKHVDFDLILLDLSMPGIDNLNGITELRRETPMSPIVIFSATEDPDIVRSTIKLGAQGFIKKSSSRDIVIAAINKILSGDIYLPDSLGSKESRLSLDGDLNFRDPANRELTSNKTVLTRRQREVLLLLVYGASNNDIAERLNLTLATVKTHVTNLFHALNVNNRSQAVYRARKMGLIRKDNNSI